MELNLLIDQNNFTSPTLDKKLNEDLSILNDKSIVLPLGEVNITRKVKSILLGEVRISIAFFPDVVVCT